jgi:hypothetical protein
MVARTSAKSPRCARAIPMRMDTGVEFVAGESSLWCRPALSGPASFDAWTRGTSN